MNSNTYIEKKNAKDKKYFIHDNYLLPFLVHVTNKKITIHVNSYKDLNANKNDTISYKKDKINNIRFEEEIKFYKKHFISFDYEGYWYGKDVSDGYWCAYKQDGCNILVKLDKYRYIHIGKIIYNFKTKEEILDYTVNMGKNDVSYSIAFTKNNLHFIDSGFDHKYISKNRVKTKITYDNADKLYDEYYNDIKKISCNVIGFEEIHDRIK